MNTAQEAKRELEQIVTRIGEIEKEKKTAEGMLETAKNDDASLDRRIEAMRKERQELLVDGGDVEDVNRRINDSRHQDELIEDTIIGLQQKIDRLDKEAASLAARRIEVKELILKEETVRPLIDRYNKLAIQSAEILAEIDAALDEFDTLQTAGRPMNTLTKASSGGTLPHIIPQVFFEGEPDKPHAFDRGKAHQARHLKQHQQETEGRYKGSACLKCERYLGVLEVATGPTCSRIKGVIPDGVLKGTTTCQENLRRMQNKRDDYYKSVRVGRDLEEPESPLAY